MTDTIVSSPVWRSARHNLSVQTEEAILDWANKYHDVEVCGFITFRGEVIPIPNVSPEPQKTFVMEPHLMVTALNAHNDIAGIYHSHPSGRIWPSATDGEQMTYFYQQGCPWDYYIVAGGKIHKYIHRDRSD